MRLGILVNDIKLEKPKYTTVRLAMTATNRGHEVWFINVGDLAYDPDDFIRARARGVKGKRYKDSEIYLKDLCGKAKSKNERIVVDDLDVLLLRNDPSIEPSNRAWARNIGINFGRLATRHGVIVLNDPNGLSNATNKMYFQQFPEEVRPKTIITRDRKEIKKFVKQHGKVVLKPVSGSGGRNVFLVSRRGIGKLNKTLNAVSKDGYVVAQEYLPDSEKGDTRLFLLNGVPLRHRGKYAAFRRLRCKGRVVSNVSAGAETVPVELDEQMMRVAEIVRPKIVQDGMFFVGLDIVGDKILEINVFTPGGLGTAQKHEGVNFARAVISAIERKVKYMSFYRRKFNNTEMATL